MADLPNLQHAVRFVFQDKEDEWIRDPLRDVPFRESLDARLTDLAERLRSGDYEPRRTTIVELAKGNFTTRPLSQVDLADWVVAQAILNIVAPTLDGTIPPPSYAMRLNPKRYNSEKQKFFKGWYREWPKFLKRIRQTVSAIYPCLVVTDISGYFEHIDLGQLKEMVLGAGVSQEVTDLAMDQLEMWTWRDRYSVARSKGLLQGNDISSMLSNFYLHDVDLWLQANNVNFQRYIDDFNIHVQSRSEGKRILTQLTRILRRKGLSLNSGKTRILCDAEIEDHFNFLVSDELEMNLKELKNQGDIAPVRTARRRLRRRAAKLRAYNPHIFKRLITAYTRSRDRTFLGESLELLVSNPDLTPNLCKYFRAIDTNDVVARLIQFLRSTDDNVFASQEQEVLETLLLMTARPPSMADLVQLSNDAIQSAECDPYSKSLYILLLYRVGDTGDLTRLVDRYLKRRDQNRLVRKHLALACTRLVDPPRLNSVIEMLKREADPDLTEVGVFIDEMRSGPAAKVRSVIKRTRLRTDFYDRPLNHAVPRLDVRDLLLLNICRESTQGQTRSLLRTRLTAFEAKVSCPRSKALLTEALSRI